MSLWLDTDSHNEIGNKRFHNNKSPPFCLFISHCDIWFSHTFSEESVIHLVMEAPLVLYSTHAWYVMPRVLNQVYMHDRKIWKHFHTCGNGPKMTKCDQVFHPRSDFFNFCNPHFFYYTLTDGVGLVDRAFAEICDHSLFTCQSR